MIQGNAKAPPTLIQGYVYLDDELVIPEKVSLILSTEMINATIFNDGRYIITLTETEPGTTEKYLVIYNEKRYTPKETFTIQENIYMYNIDLHIQTTDDNNQSVDEKIRPIARAGGPYTEIITVPIFFNASESYDLDGVIANYQWDFGDIHTATGINPEHTYSSIGKYKVTLTVTDNDGLTDSNITFAYIIETANNPPDKPTITGIKKGTINTLYEFNITAFDLDNDTIKYNIDWNDNTETTITEYLNNGTIITVNHTWTQPSEYILKVNAEDEKNAISETTEHIILIDSHYVKNLGYLVDYTNDGTYNTFYSNTTNNETLTKIQNGNYLIDSNNDGEYDYQYNIITDQISSYQLETDVTEQETKEEIPLFILIYIMIVAVIILSLIIGIYIIRKQKPKKEKVYYVQEPEEEIEVETEEETLDHRKETVEDIEEQIDELLKNKKL